METVPKRKFTFSTIQIALVGVLMAMNLVLSQVSVPLGEANRISFGFLPTAVIALLFGPWVAGIASALTDLLSFFLFSSGFTFFIGFTFSAFLGGVIYGVFLHRIRVKWYHVLGAVLVNTLVTNLFFNSLWLNILYETPFWALMPGRILQNAIMAPIRYVLIFAFATTPQLRRLYDGYTTAKK